MMIQVIEFIVSMLLSGVVVYIALRERILRLEIGHKSHSKDIAAIELRLDKGAETMKSLEIHIQELNLTMMRLNTTIELMLQKD